MTVYTLMVMAVALASAPQSSGAPAESAISYLGWQEQEGPLTMTLSNKAIAVCFTEGLELARKQEIMKSNGLLAPDALWNDLGKKGVHVVALKESLSNNEVLGVLRQLETFSEIEYAAPVIEFMRYFSAVTNRFYLDFSEPAPEKELAELNKKHAVEIDRVLRYPKIDCVAYYLRVSKASGVNAAELATLYTETLAPRNSGPCTIYLADDLASNPNDMYYERAEGEDIPDQYYLHTASATEYGINMPDVWTSITGSEHIVVAVIDNGVDLYYQQYNGQGHTDLGTGSNGYLSNPSNQWVNSDESFTSGVDEDDNGYVNDRYGWNFSPNEGGGCCTNPKIPEGPGFAHGTFSAGVIAALTNNSIGMAGIAGGWLVNPGNYRQGCKIMPLRAENDGCCLFTEDVADAINYAVDNGARVLNMNLGGYTLPNGLTLALNNARASDVLPIAGAHNHDEYNNFPYPQALETVLIVGALNICDVQMRKFGSNTGNVLIDDTCNPYWQGPCLPGLGCDCDANNHVPSWGTNHGYKLDICSSGIKIWTLNTNDGYTDDFDKTSSTTPQVSGVAALLFASSLDANNQPRLSANQVQAILEFSATDLDYTRTYNGGTEVEDAGPGRDEYTGYGRLNAAAALELAKAPRFVIRNEENKHCASFDDRGNLVVEGGLTQVAGALNLNPTDDNEFIIRDSNNDEIVRVNTPLLHYAAEMFIKGKLYERVSISLNTGMPARSFRIKNGAGDTMAIITSQSFTNSTLEPTAPNTVPAGSVILKGRCFIGGCADRLSSQGK